MNWTMSRMMELATGYWASGALQAAVRLDLFSQLDEAGGQTAAAAAAALGADERRLAALLDALAGLGLLEQAGGRFKPTASAAVWLCRNQPQNLLEALQFNADLYPLWGALADTIRAGKPALPPQAHLGQDPARTRRFVRGMHSRAQGLAPALLPELDTDRVRTLLDVGSGPGTFSRMLAEAEEQLAVTQFDLPPVLDVARELTADSPAAARIAFVPGDYRRDPLPAGFDAILYCGALHQENAASAAALFRQFRAALKPDGVLWVVDLMLDDDRREPVFAALFSLNMMLVSPIAGVFTRAEARSALAAAGFDRTEARALPDIPYTLIVAQSAAST